MTREYGIEYLEKALSPKRFYVSSNGDTHCFFVKYTGRISELSGKIKKCGLDIRMETPDTILVFSKDGPGLDLMRAYHSRNLKKTVQQRF